MPACRSVDVITVFAGCVADGVAIRRIAEGFDPADPFSRVGLTCPLPARPRVGVLRPEDRQFYGDAAAASLYDAAVERLSALDATAVPFQFAPFREAAALLYQGPWVAERLAALESVLDAQSGDLDPAVRAIVEGASRFSAVDAFRGVYRLEELRRQTEATWAACDMLLLPTAPTIYTVEAMRADPLRLNSNIGTYTNFANLLGLAAVAVPAGFRPNGLPFGVTLVGPGSSDDALAGLADALHRASDSGMGRPRTPLPASVPVPPVPKPNAIEFAVVGAHLTGLPLNGVLTTLGASFVRKTRTASDYRLFALPDTTPPKPGLVREPGFEGPGIAAEIWSLQPDAFAHFVVTIPSPLGIGRILLQDGTTVLGFLCESWATVIAFDGRRFLESSCNAYRIGLAPRCRNDLDAERKAAVDPDRHGHDREADEGDRLGEHTDVGPRWYCFAA